MKRLQRTNNFRFIKYVFYSIVTPYVTSMVKCTCAEHDNFCNKRKKTPGKSIFLLIVWYYSLLQPCIIVQISSKFSMLDKKPTLSAKHSLNLEWWKLLSSTSNKEVYFMIFIYFNR